DGDMRERTAVVALVTTHAPLLDPLLLHVGLSALRADERAFHVMDHLFFFRHIVLLFQRAAEGAASFRSCEVPAEQRSHGLHIGHFFLYFVRLKSNASY